MSSYLSNKEIDQAVGLLINTYQVPNRIIQGLLGRENIKEISRHYKTFKGGTLSSEELARMVVIEKGAELFKGSGQAVRQLREHLLRQLSEQELIGLYERNPRSGKKITSPSYMFKALAEKRWSDGRVWPRDFVSTLGFPLVFSGVKMPQQTNQSAVMDVEARKTVPPLVDFQEQLKDDMLDVLELNGDQTRCIVTLPTGGGKTRVAVESFIEWMHTHFSEQKYMIWIAQSAELCEQAISCIADMWQEKDYPETLRVYRYFNGGKVGVEDLTGGAVVASIQQIVSRLKAEDPVLTEILKNCGAMIIDEAHHAAAPSYKLLINKARELCGEDLFPVCGLTATPGRSFGETEQLVGEFEAHLIKPQLPDYKEYEENPIRYFRDEGFLATPIHIVHESGKDYEVDEDDVNEDQDLTKEFLKELAADEGRNEMIIERLLNIPKGKPVLVYACTVDHAEFLSSVMNALGRKAASISSQTSKGLRRIYIDAFKKGELDYLFNYGVLTTGFDAPNTEYIVMTRPTTSDILYEQIIGRGLRGPKFGGTEQCAIIDFADNLMRLGKPLAYTRFEHFWGAQKVERT
ncbi:superfamily II DNA or RNA helicase [Alkalibacillus filiformis]|uniref:Superfamily II DNA or RNA helicase n=1 Tax=Alkalibacillus filiformis TaxID=200990 RepID=A0ABU0DUR4_9BACI|nr:DEAD/DEAH box helicase [Alkalibacillus filiformis]MDQ0352200.1 superfamily II DNA or RNA helicase [Alkalibacillus filiformis]